MSLDPNRAAKNIATTDNQSSPIGSPPPRKKRRLWLWVLSIFFGGGFLCLLICCGVGAYVVQNYGSVLFDPTRAQLNQLADLREEVGTIESLTINFSASIDEAKANPEFMILQGQSETGPVQLSVKMNNSGELEKVFLVLPDESRKPIDLERHQAGDTGAAEPQSVTEERAETKKTPSGPDPQEPEADSIDSELRDPESELELQ